MNIIIAGSRTFNDYDLLQSKCDEILFGKNSNTLNIICGEAQGADSLGKKYAIERQINVISMPAEWENLDQPDTVIKTNKFGKKYNVNAGKYRNEQMAIKASEDNGMLVAFWDQKSPGTQNMINLAEKYKLNIYVVKY